jgi:sulfur carrier protein
MILLVVSSEGEMAEQRPSITILLNGSSERFDHSPSILVLVASLARSPKGIAVAVNGEIVPRSLWGATMIVDDDHVEIVTAAAGG